MATTVPYADVDSTLRALAGRAEGFGRFAVGGVNGPVHHVTSLAGLSLSFHRILLISSMFIKLLYNLGFSHE
ncbi:putative pectate lyase [Helianthus annuus]|nr:putative pectate lyase [Helianthus annuus]KAJ0732341.1 putative pectate lyase [Helianthus annuus]